MRVLIVGGSSLLGKYLTKTKPTWVTNLSCTWYANHIDGYQLDISVKSQVGYILQTTKPDLVINCAAIGSVDFAQDNYKAVYDTNVIGLENLIKESYKARLIHISSNAVYGGDKPPYTEDSVQKPVNLYGRIKHLSEQSLMIHPDWVIIRPYMLYGWPYPYGRGNWVKMIVEKLQNNEQINLVNDVYWQPTYVEDVAQAIWQLALNSNPKQSYNVAANNSMTLFELGLIIADIWGLDVSLIKAIKSSDLVGVAPRPKNTRYDLTKIEKTGIKIDGILSGLERMKNEQI